MTLAHTIPMELVNKILTYRPSHPIKALIDVLYVEIKNSEIYKNNIGRFEKDREITLSSGDFMNGLLWNSVNWGRRIDQNQIMYFENGVYDGITHRMRAYNIPITFSCDEERGRERGHDM